MEQATRFPWSYLPAVFIHAGESFVKTHHAYAAAKSGDSLAAMELVSDAVSIKTLEQLWKRFNDWRQYWSARMRRRRLVSTPYLGRWRG